MNSSRGPCTARGGGNSRTMGARGGRSPLPRRPAPTTSQGARGRGEKHKGELRLEALSYPFSRGSGEPWEFSWSWSWRDGIYDVGPRRVGAFSVMGKVRVLVRCPVCGLSSSTERLKKGPWSWGVVTKWVTSGGRGKIQNHYALLPSSPAGKHLLAGVLRHLIATLEVALERLIRLRDSLTEPFASARSAPLSVSHLPETFKLTSVTATQTFRLPLTSSSTRVAVRRSS